MRKRRLVILIASVIVVALIIILTLTEKTVERKRETLIYQPERKEISENQYADVTDPDTTYWAAAVYTDSGECINGKSVSMEAGTIPISLSFASGMKKEKTVTLVLLDNGEQVDFEYNNKRLTHCTFLTENNTEITLPFTFELTDGRHEMTLLLFMDTYSSEGVPLESAGTSDGAVYFTIQCGASSGQQNADDLSEDRTDEEEVPADTNGIIIREEDGHYFVEAGNLEKTQACTILLFGNYEELCSRTTVLEQNSMLRMDVTEFIKKEIQNADGQFSAVFIRKGDQNDSGGTVLFSSKVVVPKAE